MRIVVALEPRSHRDTLCDAIAHLRPTFDTRAIGPGELGRWRRECARAVVLLSAPLPAAQELAFASLVLDQGTDGGATLRIAGAERAIDSLELSVLLALLDECAAAERAERRHLAAAPEGANAVAAPGPLDGLWQRLATRWRTLRRGLAPWQYVHLVLIPALLLIVYGLVCGGRAALLGPADSGLLLGALAGIAAIEARQCRRTHGAWARG